jgi:DNA-binding transcriptional ArsR family regulator
METLGTEILAHDLEPLVRLFRLLADKTRLNILTILSRGERNVSSLCGELGLPQPTVSHHLGLLRTNNLINNRREGKQIFYGLSDQIDVGAGDGMLIGAEPFKVRIGDAS